MDHRFNIDLPAARIGFSGNPVCVAGWFADRLGRPAKVVRVRNGGSVHPAMIQVRPDVVSSLSSGFSQVSEDIGFQVDVPTGIGPRRLVVEAETLDGERVRLGSLLLWMKPHRFEQDLLAMPGDESIIPAEGEAGPAPRPDVKAIAFYLPQFHAIPENDRWWGSGFTEWTNVRPSVPRFEGHQQPHVPHTALGYYDLNDETVLERQAAMARAAGIFGFCYYWYWFGGKRLLEMPLERMLQTGRPAMPFCVCWANENWSRRWDGRERDILVAQRHSPEDDDAFIADLSRAFGDTRYIRIGGRPLLLVYRPKLLPDSAATCARWRSWCRDRGIGEIHIAGIKGFGCSEPAPLGLDSLVEFPPNDSGVHPLSRSESAAGADFSGLLFDYRQVRAGCLAARRPPYRLFRGVMPSWDNTPRRKETGTVFLHSTPGAYLNWLQRAAELTRKSAPSDERFLFINAWNEWAEGCHLEPDERHGYAWLNATRRVLGSWT